MEKTKLKIRFEKVGAKLEKLLVGVDGQWWLAKKSIVKQILFLFWPTRGERGKLRYLIRFPWDFEDIDKAKTIAEELNYLEISHGCGIPCNQGWSANKDDDDRRIHIGGPYTASNLSPRRVIELTTRILKK